MQINNSDKKLLLPFLAKFKDDEHEVWLNEAVRLAEIVIQYEALKHKRKTSKITGKSDFTKEVYELCKKAACDNPKMILREPSRARPPSPYTLDRWSKNYKQIA